MEDWFSKGCEACRQSVLSHRGKPLVFLHTNVAEHARLLRCAECGSYWIENEREAHVIEAGEARMILPGELNPDDEGHGT